MQRLLTAEQTEQLDHKTIDAGIPALILMEHAAESVVQAICRRGLEIRKTVVFCGTGNNGGDGVAAARLLHLSGCPVTAILLGDPDKFSEQLKEQIRMAEVYGVRLICGSTSQGTLAEETINAVSEAEVVVDAVFGIGLKRAVSGIFAEAIRVMNNRHEEGAFAIAVDIPSGINADTGSIYSIAANVDITVTFTAGKPGLFFYPGAAYAGEVQVSEIGIPIPENSGRRGNIYVLNDDDLITFKKRDESGNKGTFGKVLVIAGSENICGAAFLSAKAALKCGVGMVKIYTHEVNRTALATLLPEALISTYREHKWNADGQLEKDMQWADSVLIGPGLGTGDISEKILKEYLELNQKYKLPTVIDADALNILAMHPEYYSGADYACIFTPHLGEMKRLTGFEISDMKTRLLEVARHAAVDMQQTVILKDARTVIGVPGGDCYVNFSGNSGMATAGSGDVLAGIAAAFAVRFPNAPIPAAAAAAYLHGRAGDLAAAKYSESSMTASDILDFISEFL